MISVTSNMTILTDEQRQALETEYRTHAAELGAWSTRGTDNTGIVAEESGVTPLKENLSLVAHRFVKGQPGGPGRPRVTREERVLKLMDAHISDDDLIAVIKSLVAGAIAGHNKKQELLLNHLMGTPVQRTQHVGVSFIDIIASLTGPQASSEADNTD